MLANPSLLTFLPWCHKLTSLLAGHGAQLRRIFIRQRLVLRLLRGLLFALSILHGSVSRARLKRSTTMFCVMCLHAQHADEKPV